MCVCREREEDFFYFDVVLGVWRERESVLSNRREKEDGVQLITCVQIILENIYKKKTNTHNKPKTNKHDQCNICTGIREEGRKISYNNGPCTLNVS